MKISNKSLGEKLPIEVDAWKVLEGSKVVVIHMQLKPGEVVEKHNNELDVLFIITQGECTLIFNNEEHPVKQGDHICVEAGTERGWFNHSSELAEFTVIKIKV